MDNSISHVVVKFVDEIDSNGKIMVELVPRSWILQFDNLIQCLWPPSHLNKYIQPWIKESKPPSETWPKYEIEILTTANNYEKGLRQLKKSCKQATQLTSSESENRDDLTALLRSVSSQLLKQTSLSDYSLFEEVMNEPKNSARTRKSTSPMKKSADEQILSRNANQLLKQRKSLSDSSPSREPENSTVKRKSTSPTKKSADERIKILRSYIDNDLKEFISDYIDAKNEILLLSITNSITNAKRSLQYDLDKKLKTMKQCIRMESKIEQKPTLRAILETSLPIKTLDDFLKFDNSLNPNIEENEGNTQKSLEKQKALKGLYEIVTVGSNNYKADIKTIMPKIVTKTVQLEYSGKGRVVHGTSKRNFSETMVYQCMKEFLEEKYINPSTQMKILNITSRYLSGAGDRESGYAMRKNKIQQNKND